MNEFYAHPDLEDGFGATGPHRKNPHRGLDFAHDWGTPIPALRGGTVEISEYSVELGWIVEIAADDGYYPGCRHMTAPSPVAVGERVEAGQIIGYVGDTGRQSYGAHLCQTVGTGPGAVYGVPSLVIDPWPYITATFTPEPAPEEKEPIMPAIYARATTNSTPLKPDDAGSSRVWAGDDRRIGGVTYSGVWALDTDAGIARRLTMAEWRVVQGAYAATGQPIPIADVHGNDLETIISARAKA